MARRGERFYSDT